MGRNLLSWATICFTLYAQGSEKSTLRIQTPKGFCFYDSKGPILPSPILPETVYKNIRANDAIIDNPTAILALAGAGLCRSYMYQQDFVRTPIVVSACVVSLAAVAFKLFRAVCNEVKINELNTSVFTFASTKETRVSFSKELKQSLFLAQNLEESCNETYGFFQHAANQSERSRP